MKPKFVTVKHFERRLRKQQQTIWKLIRHNQVLLRRASNIVSSQKHYAEVRLPRRAEASINALRSRVTKYLESNRRLYRVFRGLHLQGVHASKRNCILRLTATEANRLRRLLQHDYRRVEGKLRRNKINEAEAMNALVAYAATQPMPEPQTTPQDSRMP